MGVEGRREEGGYREGGGGRGRECVDDTDIDTDTDTAIERGKGVNIATNERGTCTPGYIKPPPHHISPRHASTVRYTLTFNSNSKGG